MPSYKIPAKHHPTSVEELRRIYIMSVRNDLERREHDGMIWHSIINVIAEVLYVRGLDHGIVDALLKEWGRIAFELHREAQRIRERAATEARATTS